MHTSHCCSDKCDGFTGRADTGLLSDATLFLYLTCLKLRGSATTRKNPTPYISKWHSLSIQVSSSLIAYCPFPLFPTTPQI